MQGIFKKMSIVPEHYSDKAKTRKWFKKYANRQVRQKMKVRLNGAPVVRL